MRMRVERVRVWLVVGTCVLVLGVAGFLGYARYRSRAFLAGLPGRLGAEITQETNGYTYSQTLQGRTIFTLHAAKMEQRRDGVVKLHDVGVVLYGRKQDRADRIYGKEFEYDKDKGVVRALGEVHMDLQAPAPAEGSGKKQKTVNPTEGELATGNPRVIHVLTSGLVYLVNLGVAATSEDVEFSEGALTGKAHGADYSSDTGVVSLQSAVRVNGLTGGGPMVLTANRAELNQAGQVATFLGAKVVTPGETVEASHAVVHVRKDGSPERMEGMGAVRISRAAGGVVTAEEAEAELNAASKPVGLRLWGGVRYGDDDGGRHAEGRANEARVRFDGAGEAEHLTAVGSVMAEERQMGASGASSRVLTARTVELALGAGAMAKRRELKDAEAMGDARLVVVDEVGGGKQVRTEMAGDDLKSRFVGGRRIANVVGTGHTVLRRLGADGVDETSSGETTELVFRNSVGSKVVGPQAAQSGVEELASATQVGHVSMVRKGMRKQGSAMVPAEERSTADRAVYDGDSDHVTLTGGVVLVNEDGTLWAAKVGVDRGSGNATAEGGVRVTYAQAQEGGKEQEPVHVLASRAEMHAEGAKALGMAGMHRALFYGSVGKLARMWQGSSQVEAPVIELEQGARRMTASGAGETAQVHTVLLADGNSTGGAPVKGAVAAGKRESGPSVVRIVSREMVYTDSAREVVFTGGVTVDDVDGKMRSQRATVYLEPARAAGAAKTGGARAAFCRRKCEPYCGYRKGGD